MKNVFQKIGLIALTLIGLLTVSSQAQASTLTQGFSGILGPTLGGNSSAVMTQSLGQGSQLNMAIIGTVEIAYRIQNGIGNFAGHLIEIIESDNNTFDINDPVYYLSNTTNCSGGRDYQGADTILQNGTKGFTTYNFASTSKWLCKNSTQVINPSGVPINPNKFYAFNSYMEGGSVPSPNRSERYGSDNSNSYVNGSCVTPYGSQVCSPLTDLYFLMVSGASSSITPQAPSNMGVANPVHFTGVYNNGDTYNLIQLETTNLTTGQIVNRYYSIPLINGVNLSYDLTASFDVALYSYKYRVRLFDDINNTVSAWSGYLFFDTGGNPGTPGEPDEPQQTGVINNPTEGTKTTQASIQVTNGTCFNVSAVQVIYVGQSNFYTYRHQNIPCTNNAWSTTFTETFYNGSWQIVLRDMFNDQSVMDVNNITVSISGNPVATPPPTDGSIDNNPLSDQSFFSIDCSQYDGSWSIPGLGCYALRTFMAFLGFLFQPHGTDFVLRGTIQKLQGDFPFSVFYGISGAVQNQLTASNTPENLTISTPAPLAHTFILLTPTILVDTVGTTAADLWFFSITALAWLWAFSLVYKLLFHKT